MNRNQFNNEYSTRGRGGLSPRNGPSIQDVSQHMQCAGDAWECLNIKCCQHVKQPPLGVTRHLKRLFIPSLSAAFRATIPSPSPLLPLPCESAAPVVSLLQTVLQHCPPALPQVLLLQPSRMPACLPACYCHSLLCLMWLHHLLTHHLAEPANRKERYE